VRALSAGAANRRAGWFVGWRRAISSHHAIDIGTRFALNRLEELEEFA